MSNFITRCLLTAGAALLAIASFTPTSSAQIGIVIGRPRTQVIVEQPACQYGYYDYEPYECAPYGFYGPEFFYGGIFLGVGPWENYGYGHGWGEHRFEGNRYGYRNDNRYRGHEGNRGGNRGGNQNHNHGNHKQ